jgi:hypothetical protein
MLRAIVTPTQPWRSSPGAGEDLAQGIPARSPNVAIRFASATSNGSIAGSVPVPDAADEPTACDRVEPARDPADKVRLSHTAMLTGES